MTLEQRREIYLNRFRDKTVREMEQTRLKQSDIKVEKMRTRLKVHFDDLGLEQSMNALSYVCDRYDDRLRKNGELYIAHPLSMACRFQALKNPDDDIYATFILHDSIEDSMPINRPPSFSEVATAIENLPVGDTVKSAVRLMTISSLYPSEKKSEIKFRYYNDLISSSAPENKLALKCKGFDRWDNMTTITALSKRDIYKNVLENSILLLPTLKEAKIKWPRESNILFLLRDIIKSLNNIVANYCGFSDLNNREELIRLLDDERYLPSLR